MKKNNASDLESLSKAINVLKKELLEIKMRRRIFQQDIMPQAVKQRHMGEPNAYMNAGLVANRPDAAEVTSGVSAYFATDENKLYIYNGTAWVSVTLS